MTLVAKNIAVERGGRVILKDVNFTLQKGQALILRGHNGIGKTTLLRSLAGLQPFVTGQVDADMDTVAYASHADGVKSQLSVWENLEFWAQTYGTDLSDDVLESFDIADLKTRRAATLSSGQKRRLGLARLAVLPSKILLLDEPTISLDAASVRLFADFITAHLAKGGSALIATHIDLGLPDVEELDLSPFVTSADAPNDGFDEAFI